MKSKTTHIWRGAALVLLALGFVVGIGCSCKPKKVTPQVGEKYIRNTDTNPFETHPTNTVVAVKGEWVQLKDQFGTVSSMEVEDLRVLYMKVGDAPEKP
jgi:hypothetical protein